MSMLYDFLLEDVGEDSRVLGDIGFFSYTFKNGEMFVPKVFIKKEHRCLKSALQMKKEVELVASQLQAKSITGIVYLNQNNKNKFIKKLSFYEYLGFKPQYIQGNAVVVAKEL